jgi:hypothetical protein
VNVPVVPAGAKQGRPAVRFQITGMVFAEFDPQVKKEAYDEQRH